MKILVVGGGGREHALAWKLAQSPKVQAVYVAPGNGGTALDTRLENIAITDVRRCANGPGRKDRAAVVGRAASGGRIVDEFPARPAGVRTTKAAAQLESSKAFPRRSETHGIPTAEYETFHDATAATPMSMKKARRLWSRPTGWRQARAWSWP